ncbi:MAG: hypothetical protein OEM27_08865 [Nitrospinota bacterium]|nr:hypothetical protein [Nitrospinota bacterium]
MIAWVKNWMKKQVETNPVIMPFFDESKGWRWFCRIYMLIVIFIVFIALIEFVLLMIGNQGFWLSWMLEEQDPQKKIDTLGEWVFVIFYFFLLFGTLIFISRISSSSRKLILEKKIIPRVKSKKNYSPRNNFFSNYVGILLFFYLFFSLSSFVRQGIDFIASIFGEPGTIVRIVAVIAFFCCGAILMRKGILWLDKQKPVFIHISFGMVVLLYFLSFVWLLNYS